jgi:hypothetical protein
MLLRVSDEVDDNNTLISSANYTFEMACATGSVAMLDYLEATFIQPSGNLAEFYATCKPEGNFNVLRSSLRSACLAGQIAAVKWVVERRPDRDHLFVMPIDIVTHTCEKGHLEILKWILEETSWDIGLIEKVLKKRDSKLLTGYEWNREKDVFHRIDIVDCLLQKLREVRGDEVWKGQASEAYAATLRCKLIPPDKWMTDADPRPIYDAIIFHGSKQSKDSHDFIGRLLLAFVDRLAAFPFSPAEKTAMWQAVCGSRLGYMRLFADRFTVARSDVLADGGLAFARTCARGDMSAIDWAMKKFGLEPTDVIPSLRTLARNFEVSRETWMGLQKRFGFCRWDVLDDPLWKTKADSEKKVAKKLE